MASVLGQPLAAQTMTQKVVVRSDAAVARARQWVTAVLRHQPGAADRDVEEVAPWDSAVLAGITVDVHAIRRLIRDERASGFVMPSGGGNVPPPLVYSSEQLEMLRGAARDVRRAGVDENDLLARGLLLHTDIALLGRGAGTVLYFADGQERGVERGGDHWALARALASFLDERSGRQPDVRLWYRATLTALAAADLWNARHADAAAAQFPDDAELLFLAGSHHESLAAPRVQASLAGIRLPRDLVIHIGSPAEELRLAASLLKRALDRDPAHAEARIHYGRVLTLLDRSGEATTHLHRAVAEAAEPEQRYYAQLFLGAVLEATNRRAEAQTAYERAAALFPHAQAPYLALSQLAARYGDRGAAARAIEPLLALGAGEAERQDPWWLYARSTARHAERLMTQASQRLATTHGATNRR